MANPFNILQQRKGLYKDSILEIYEDKAGNIWFGTRG